MKKFIFMAVLLFGIMAATANNQIELNHSVESISAIENISSQAEAQTGFTLYEIALMLLFAFETFVRLRPTEKNYSILDFVYNLYAAFFPNFKKPNPPQKTNFFERLRNTFKIK